MRNTSLDAYERIKAEGLLSRRRFEVYEIVTLHGPVTAHRMVKFARSKYPEANQTGFNARLSELEEMGCITTVGEEINPVSGKSNLLWAVTGKLPTVLRKSEKKDSAIKEAIKKERMACAAIAFSTNDLIGQAIGNMIMERKD
jgi:hypothetical protein